MVSLKSEDAHENLDNFRSVILECCPGLAIDSLELMEGGQTSDILLVNGCTIFRFPRYADGVAGLQREAVVLTAIRGHLSVPTPIPKYVACSEAAGRAFLAYDMVPGIPLTRRHFEAVDDQLVVESVAEQLAVFLRELHGIVLENNDTHLKADVKQDCGPGVTLRLEPYRGVEYWRNMYRRIERGLFTHMSPNSRKQVENHFAKFLGTDALALSPVLVHGDLGIGNIVVQWDQKRISGVIDFGSAGLNDPAVDFAALAASFGRAFAKRVLEAYGDHSGVERRIQFYTGTFALQEALFGLENGDRQAFEQGIRGYR